MCGIMQQELNDVERSLQVLEDSGMGLAQPPYAESIGEAAGEPIR